MNFVAPLDGAGTVPCASCFHEWSVPYLAGLHAKRALRQEGFAFIDFGDALSVNYCPECERPRSFKEVPPWPSAQQPS